jgi:hypothetical protein
MSHAGCSNQIDNDSQTKHTSPLTLNHQLTINSKLDHTQGIKDGGIMPYHFRAILLSQTFQFNIFLLH